MSGAAAGSPRPARGLVRLALAAMLLAGFATPGPRAGEPPPPRVETRQVIVTDTCCAAEGARRDDHRACALECVSEGGRLILFDPRREALYEIAYATEELRIHVLNDLAGLPIRARGIWDDENHLVSLSVAKLASPPPDPELRDENED